MKKESQRIKKIAEQQKNMKQRFQETLGKTGSFNKDSTPHTVHRTVKLVGVIGRKTSEQLKPVKLRPVLSDGETDSKKVKNERQGE